MTGKELAGVDRLLIDGNNLLHRVAGSVEPGAQRLLLARLRAAIPSTVSTTLMLDGHAAAGTKRHERLPGGLEIRHSGSLSADDAIVQLINEHPPQRREAITVVSDDRSLVERVRSLGARTQRLEWLEQLIARPGGSSTGSAGIGAGRPKGPHPPQPPAEEREPWKPGRGATRKRGNPQRNKR